MDDDELKEVSINLRTPETEARNILGELAHNYAKIKNSGDFIKNFFPIVWHDKKTNGEDYKKIFYQWMDEEPDKIKDMNLHFIIISCAYCVQAMKEYEANNHYPTNLAWAYITEANFWRYTLRSVNLTHEETIGTLRKNASRAARARHAQDPKQRCLQEIEKKVIQNRDKFNRRGHAAQFVREMAEQYPIIESFKTIEKLVARIKKEHP